VSVVVVLVEPQDSTMVPWVQRQRSDHCLQVAADMVPVSLRAKAGREARGVAVRPATVVRLLPDRGMRAVDLLMAATHLAVVVVVSLLLAVVALSTLVQMVEHRFSLA